MKNDPKPRATRGRPPLGSDDRQRILEATSQVFLEKGYERASTTEIARRARTSKQTLYGMFPSKADLFLAVMNAHTEKLFSHHRDFLASTSPFATILTQMGEEMLRMFTAPEFLALYRIVVAEAPRFPELAQRLWTNCAEHGHSLLAELLHSRNVGGPDYRKSGIQFVTFILGDFILNHMLNPQAQMAEPAIQTRVQEAVQDFLTLHPVCASS